MGQGDQGRADSGELRESLTAKGTEAAKEERSFTAKDAKDAEEENSLTAKAAKDAKNSIIKTRKDAKELRQSRYSQRYRYASFQYCRGKCGAVIEPQ